MSKFDFPPAVEKDHTAVLGKTGAGKTSTTKLIVERLVAKGARVCILDPIKSDWWGVISSANGKRAGLPFRILGGPRGHVPLHSSAGKAVAEIVANGSLPLSVVDMADFEAGGLQRFFVDFAQALFRKNKGVLYLVIEEAHEFAPKERSGIGAENMAIHLAKKLASGGRSKGIRLIVATQRTQKLHNDLLGSCETMIVHRFTAPADQAPITKWLKANTDKDTAKEIESQLSSLPTGTGWVISGEDQVFERVAFPRITTFDNTATPDSSLETIDVTSEPVDQEELRAIIGEAVKEAEANDPKALKAEIATLKRDLAKAQDGAVDETAIEKVREEEYQRGLATGLDRAQRELTRLLTMIGTLSVAWEKHYESLTPVQQILLEANGQAAVLENVLQSEAVRTVEKLVEARRPTASKPVAKVNRSVPAPRREIDTDTNITPARQKILDALAWLKAIGQDDADRAQLAFLADASPKSSAYANNLGALRSGGLIEYGSGKRVFLTDTGGACAVEMDVPLTNEALHQMVRDKLVPARRRILDALIDVYPQAYTKQELADVVEASVTSSAFANNLGAMRTLGLLDYPESGTVAASEALFPL